MSPYPFVIAATAVMAFFLQTQLPRYRIAIMTMAVAVVAVVDVINPGVEIATVYAAIPWGVIVILGALNVFARILGHSGLFERVAFATIRRSNASGPMLVFYFCTLMFVMSCLVNNLTALYLVLPMVFEAVRSLRPGRRYALLLFGLLIPICNLGGAATPIGDFPALLLLSERKIDFVTYLVQTFPVCAAVSVLVILLLLVMNRKAVRESAFDLVERSVIIGYVERLYAGLPINGPIAASVFVAVGVMFVGWVASPVTPEMVAVIGTLICVVAFAFDEARKASERAASHLLVRRIRGSRDPEARKEKDLLESIIDPVPLIFFFCVFFIVTSIEQNGLIANMSAMILSISDDPRTLALLIVVFASAFSAIFSAGPGMALAIPLAGVITERLADPHTLYIGIALGICSGSSLFLTAATAGPILQRELELAQIETRDSSLMARLNVQTYFQVGFVAWLLTLAAGILWALLVVH